VEATCRSAELPRRWAIIGMNPIAVEFGMMLSRSGFSVSFAEVDDQVRDAGIRQFQTGLEECVRDGWLNQVEAEQKRKIVAFCSDECGLDSADVYATVPARHGSVEVECRAGLDQHATLLFDASPLNANTVRLEFRDDCVDFSAELAHALLRCGKRVHYRGR